MVAPTPFESETSVAERLTQGHKIRRKRTFRGTLITGTLIILPVFITIWVIRFVFQLIAQLVTPLLLRIFELMGFGWFLERSWVGFTVPGVSVLLLLGTIFLIGLVGGNVIGKQMINVIERLLKSIPVVSGIYSAVRQFLDTFSNSGRAFSKVVLIQYPRKGLWTLALLTNDTEGEVRQQVGTDLVSVFVPTTPNPTSGWLLFVPKTEVIELHMSVDDAFKMIISGGVLIPEAPKALTSGAASAGPNVATADDGHAR